MSDKVDQRIVEMSFDNEKFEKGISKSYKSLKEFDKALEFEGATKGVEHFTATFTKMGAVTFGIIQNLTNRIVNFGIKAIKSLTLQPLLEGMGDYNTKLTTMQTITNATGKTISEVEEYFSQLDEYADKTIYNLTDMTSAMAKFSNAGVSLDKSVPAIKGIANMTALAGQNAQSASIAMYNLSQSIAGGFLNRMDFKSLELANVATIEWKQTMADAAVAAGTLTKTTNGYKTASGKAYSMQQLFVDGLQEQWATTDVLLKVLGDYGDETTEIGKKAQAAAQDVKSFGMMIETLRAAIGTGWTRSFELIFGNLEESKRLWTDITNAASAFLDTISEKRNLMLEFWHDNDGREAFINGLRNTVIALVTVLVSVSKAFDQIFPPKTQQQFVDMFKTFEKVTEKLILSEETADKLRRTFAGVFAVVDIGVETLKFFGSILGEVIRIFAPGFGGGVLDVTANLGDFLVALRNVIVYSDAFKNILQNSGGVTREFGNGIKTGLYILAGYISGLINGTVTLEDILSAVGDAIKHFRDLADFSAFFQTALDNLYKFTSFVSSKVLPVLEWLGERIKDIGLKEIGIIAIGVGLIAMSKTILKVFSPISNIFEGFSSVLTSVSKAIKGFTLNIKAQALMTIAKAIALLTASLIALAFVPADKLAISLTALTVMMAELTAALLILGKMNNSIKVGTQLTALSAGLFVVAKAAASFASISWEGLAKAGVAIGGFLSIIVVFSKVMNTFNSFNFALSSTGMLKFAAGIAALAGALSLLSSIPSDKLIHGTLALGALLAMITVYSNFMDGFDFAMASGGMVKFAIGIAALTGALALLGNLSPKTLIQGSVALLSLLSTLALYVKMVNGKDWTKANTGLIGLGLGILALTGTLSVLGNLPFDTLAKGSVALLGILSILALFVNLTNGKDVSVTGGALIGLGVGLMALTAALAILGSLDTNSLIQGTLAITALMTVIAAFIKITNGSDLGVSASGMIAFAAGIGLLAGVLALLTLVDTNALLASAAAISGIVLAIGGFSKLTNLGSLATSALGLGLFAVALAGLSIPIKMIADIPWQQLASTGAVIISTVGMLALVGALMPVFAAIGPTIPAALLGVLGVGAIVLEIGLLIAAFGALSKIPGATEIVNDGGAMLLAIGAAIGNFVGGIIGGVGEGVTSSLPVMANNISAFGVAIQPFFESIKGIDTEAVQAVKYLAETLLILGAASVVDSLSSWLVGENSLTTFAAELKAFAPDFISFSNIISSGNVNADLIKKTANAAKAMAELASELPNQGASVASWFVGDNTLSVFAAELKAFAPDFVAFANTVANGNIDEAIIQKTANAAKAMAELASELPNQGASVASWFVGDNTLSVFAAELAKFAPDFVYFANTVANGNINQAIVEKTANAASAMASLAETLPNQGGMAAWFKGDNTLSAFAAELAKFAPDFALFATELTNANMDGDVVKKTSMAAQAMAELASSLPNQGGMAAWFKGDNTLSAFADELVAFAPKFVEFTKTISQAQTTTVLPSMTLLNQVVEKLKIAGKESIENLGKSFEKNTPKALDKIRSSMQKVSNTIDGYKRSMVNSGENIVKGIIEGIKNQKSSLIRATQTNVVNAVEDTIHTGFDMHSPGKIPEKDGKNAIQGFINGVIKKKDELIGAMKSVTQGAVDTTANSGITEGLESLLGKLKDSFKTGGSEAGDSLSSGLSNSNYMDAFNQLTNSGENSTKKVKTAFEKFKDWIEEEKFYARIDTSGEIEEWEKQQKLYKKGTDERKEIDRQLYTLRNRLIDETYQNEMDAIEKKNYYGQLSLKEELKRLRTLKDTAKLNAEDREKLNRDIFALEKKIYETTKQYIDDVHAAQKKASEDRLKAQEEYSEAVAEAEAEASKDRIAAQKKYDNAITEAEKDANKKREDAHKKYNDSVQKANEDAADDRIKLEEELSKDLQEIQDKLFKDLEATEKKYTDALKSRADTIYGYYKIFDSVSERTVTTPEDILKNLTAQNSAIEDWRYSLEQLEGRGVTGDLLEELRQLGVSSSGELSAMLAMTDEQLNEFISLFERKHELANSQAIGELVDYREEINNEISALYAQADSDMESRVEKYNAALTDLNASLQTELDKAQTTLDETLTEINNTLTEKTTEAKTTLDETLSEIDTNLQDKLTKAKTTFNETMTQINQDLAGNLKTLKDNFEKTMETVHDKSTSEYKEMNKDLAKELKKLNTEVDAKLTELETTTGTKSNSASTALSTNVKTGSDEAKKSLKELNDSVNTIFSTFEKSLYDIGLNGATGLANGLRAGQYLVKSAGEYIGNAAIKAAKSALNEHSPSKEMEEVGMYADLGLINGLISYASKVEDAGSSVGKSVIDAIGDTLARIATMSFDLLDLNPTITPVLDLSDVRRNAGMLNSLLSADQSYVMGQSSLQQAQRAASVQNGSTYSSNETKIYNSFNLEGLVVRSDADIDLIANKLYQKQVSASRGQGSRPSISTRGRR